LEVSTHKGELKILPKLTLFLLLTLLTAESLVRPISRPLPLLLRRPSLSNSAGMARLARVSQENRPFYPILHHQLLSLCLAPDRSLMHSSDLAVSVSAYGRLLFDHIFHLPSCLLLVLSYQTHRCACHYYCPYPSYHCVCRRLCSSEVEGSEIESGSF